MRDEDLCSAAASVQMPLRTRMRTLGCVAASTLALAGCGSGLAAEGSSQQANATRAARARGACPRRTGFELSLVRDRGGRPTPVAAARWFATHGGIRGIPQSGWRLKNENRGGATLASHRSVLYAVRGGDGTWQVDGGYTCTPS